MHSNNNMSMRRNMDAINLDKDLAEAKDILEGRTLKQPTVAHLRAMQNHHDDSLIVLALEAAKLHDKIMASE